MLRTLQYVSIIEKDHMKEVQNRKKITSTKTKQNKDEKETNNTRPKKLISSKQKSLFLS